jgi:hypothetical protein
MVDNLALSTRGTAKVKRGSEMYGLVVLVSVADDFNPLKPSGYYMYHQV